VIELTIAKATPSLNAMLGQFWHKRTKQKKEWRWLVRAAKLEAKVFLEAPLPRARVTTTRHGRRICDTDNLYGGQKMLSDCLVREGILEDDTPAHIELVAKQIVVRTTKETKTLVQIEAI
jgi:Holliday junction resolvase RusA-like endonuclease